MKPQQLIVSTILALSSILLFACNNANQNPDENYDLLIKNVSMISAQYDGEAKIADIAIKDGLIASVGEPNSLQSSKKGSSAEGVIDGSGMFLSPGLIDGHTHLYSIPGMRFDQEERFPGIAAAARKQVPLSYLYFGFTTIVDLNSRRSIIEKWNDKPLRPQAYFCGAAPIIDGYPTSYIPKPARYRVSPNYLVEDPDTYPDLADFDPSKHTPSAVVDSIKADGAICVKTHYESGFGGRNNLPTPSIRLIKDLVLVANKHKLPVLLHANSQEAQQFGVETGVDAIVHGLWTWNDNKKTELNSGITEILDGIKQEGIGWQPTIQVLFGERDLFNPNYFSHPEMQHIWPQNVIKWYISEEGQWFKSRLGEAPYVAGLIDSGRWEDIDVDAIKRVKGSLRYLANNDGLLLFGSDTPSDETFANPPGLNGRLEIQQWFESGVSLKQIFEAATINNARFFGLDEILGTVEEGKQADLLLLKENPLLAVSAYDSIETVILDGVVISRESLSALNAEIDN